MEQSEIQINRKISQSQSLSKQKNIYPFYEAGHLRRAKMHAARYIDSIDNKQFLNSTLYQLLEASLMLETTDCDVLAAYLRHSPAVIRTELQKIHRFNNHPEKSLRMFTK